MLIFHMGRPSPMTETLFLLLFSVEKRQKKLILCIDILRINLQFYRIQHLILFVYRKNE